jgi:hypothetical protein
MVLLDLFVALHNPAWGLMQFPFLVNMTAKSFTKKLPKAYVCHHTSYGFTLSALFIGLNESIADYATEYTQNIDTDLVPHQ